jgi:hypothetical protein
MSDDRFQCYGSLSAQKHRKLNMKFLLASKKILNSSQNLAALSVSRLRL